jgi:hypothetical protein
MLMECLQFHTRLPVGDESDVKFSLQSKIEMYLNFESAIYREPGYSLRFDYPAVEGAVTAASGVVRNVVPIGAPRPANNFGAIPTFRSRESCKSLSTRSVTLGSSVVWKQTKPKVQLPS